MGQARALPYSGTTPAFEEHFAWQQPSHNRSPFVGSTQVPYFLRPGFKPDIAPDQCSVASDQASIMDQDDSLSSETDDDIVSTGGADADCSQESSASASHRRRPRAPRHSSSIKSEPDHPSPVLAVAPYVDALELSSPTSSSSTPTTTLENTPTADCGTPATTLSQASTASATVAADENEPTPQAAPRRGRGRPRKDPVARVAFKMEQKALRRTKTGCATCRRRKKKCDEARPECRNCVDNNFECEGYAERRLFTPGTKRKGSITSYSDLEPSTPFDNRILMPVNAFPAGIKSNLDHDLFMHFGQHVARTLTSRPSGTSDPFIQIVIPMASAYEPLMYSLLALSSAHMLKYKKVQEVQMRHMEHMSKSITMLRKHVEVTAAHRGDVADEMIASMLMHYVITLMSGTYRGEHEVHFQMARDYIRFRTAEKFGKFAKEFHDYYDALQRTSQRPKPWEVEAGADALSEEVSMMAAAAAAVPVDEQFQACMLGVSDGLLSFTKPVQHIRNIIREQRKKENRPYVDFPALAFMSTIARWLNDWQNTHEVLSVEWLGSEIFRGAFDINLHRTMRASRPEASLRAKVERGILLFEFLNDRVDQLRLLSALFLFGAAAFDADHQERISELFDLMYSQIRDGNILRAKEVVQEVWRAMAEQDEGRSWDWESIKDAMGYNFHIV